MIEYIYDMVKEDMARKENKMEENQEKRKKKKELKELEKKILSLRAKEPNSKMESKNRKGEVQVITWKGITIGEYTGPGLLGPTLEKFRKDRFDFEQINGLLDKASPVKSLQLYNGRSSWCSNGEIDMSSRDFTGHCLDHHRGITPKDSQLNKPPLVDWNQYYDDYIMEKFCFTDEELDLNIINNN